MCSARGIKKGPQTESYNCVVVLEKFRARCNSQEEVSFCLLFFFVSVSFCLPLTRPLSMSPSSSLFLTQIALPLGSGLARMLSDRLSRQWERRVQTEGHPDCLVRSTGNTHARTQRRTVTHFVSVRKILLIIADLGASIRHLNAQETAKISLQGCGWHRGSSPSQNSRPYTYTSTCRILYKCFLSNMLSD